MKLAMSRGEKSNNVSTAEAKDQFAEQLKNAINHVNDLQTKSDIKTNQLVRGEDVDLHDVMITAQKAGVTLQAATEIQNKVIEAYREVMRMQI
ncbi:flagellar hook-basal body complex protein FliE [Allobacillus salarius]|uniref:Flagellar hook-basal body complex protein FliE n=2 Tax=Bacillaceae TaxID=186817 RepID=A0A556PSB1_9BACI|nr:flagellar hook-basal body complex protein FliE [Allobacillus salarius]